MPRLKPLAVSLLCILSAAGCANSSHREAGGTPAAQPAPSARPLPVTAQAMVRLGRHYEAQRRHAEAIAAYRQALKRDPLRVEAYTGLGTALAAQGRYDEAVREFQAAVVLAPESAQAHNNLGYAYLLGGMREKALHAFEEAQRLDPEHRTSRENLHIARAWIPDTPRKREPSPPIEARGLDSGPDLVQVAPHVYELKGAPPAPPAAPAVPPPAKAAPVRAYRLEISNGNGVEGLARRVAAQLRSQKIRTARLTNQRPFDRRATEIQYRAGYAAEAAHLGAALERSVPATQTDGLAPGIEVRLVLGSDTPSTQALFERNGVLLARKPE